MSKGDSVLTKGIVVKAFPGAKFNVELENGEIVYCYLSGKFRHSFEKGNLASMGLELMETN